MLAESYVGDYLSTNVIVEQLDELLAAHAQVGTQGGGGETDEECLVADADTGSIVVNGHSRNLRPRIHKSFLKKWGLQTLHTQIAHDKLAYLTYVALKHGIARGVKGE